MLDNHAAGAGAPDGAGALDAVTLRAWKHRMRRVDRRATDAERIDQIRALEELACAAAAAQATLTADFDRSQRAEQAAAGVPAERQGRGVAGQVALARRESPHRGQQHLGLARILETELPFTRAAFAQGRITEWRATLVARETACLAVEDRRTIDEAVASDPRRIEAMGDGELIAETRRLAYRLDPESFVARRRKAESERNVTLRPAPDTMTYLTGLLPVVEGVAVYAALTRAADSCVAAGDARSRGQIMADTLVARVAGQTEIPTSTPVVPVTVELVITDEALLGESDEPGMVDGYGVVPAELVRELVAAATDVESAAWLRRVYTAPGTEELVAMESQARLFPAALARLIRLRDQVCRTPWCDAPIRHSDHVVDHAAGGPTSFANGQGLCQACNHAKQAPGWQARPRPGPRHTVGTRTPTGHHYRSTAPPAPRIREAQAALETLRPTRSSMDVAFRELVLAS